MENSSIFFNELYDFCKKEYGILNMSLTFEADSDCIAEIEMLQSGFVLLMNDLLLLKASRNVASKHEEADHDEKQCSFDEVMQFNG